MRRRTLRYIVALVLSAGTAVATTAAASASDSHGVGSASSGTAPVTYYVDKASQDCSNTGPGTLARPFCTIQAGADAAHAGDTVAIAAQADGANAFGEAVTVHNSGTASAPITFEPYGGPYFSGNEFGNPGFKIDSVHDIVISGLESAGSEMVSVDNSTGIVIENSVLWADVENGVAVDVEGASSVTVQRSDLGSTTNDSNAVVLGPGSSGVIADNLVAQSGTAIEANGTAAGTEIVANTIHDSCGPGIEVVGASAHADIENNVIDNTHYGPDEYIGCDVGGPTTLVAIEGASGAGSGVTEQYNTVANDLGGTVPFIWNGTKYTTVAAYTAATGNGASDYIESTVAFGGNTVPTDPDVIGVANPAAPGQPATDYYGQSPVGATPDRGAFQFQNSTTETLEATGAETQTVDVNLVVQGIPWMTAGATQNGVTYSWGDGTPDTTVGVYGSYISTDFRGNFSSAHTYALAGTFTITATLSDTAGTFTKTMQVTTGGSTYLPVSPTRVLDTRRGLGAAKAAVAAYGTVAVDVTSGVAGIPAGDTITAAVLNLTATQPTKNGYISAYPAGSSRPTSSNVNFAANQTVANLATVRVGAGGKVDLYNASSGSTQLVADVEGYYVAGGSGAGYVPVNPDRLLDTRKGIGAAKAAVARYGQLSLKVAGSGPVPASGTVAVALNVTVTTPTAGGYLTVWPDGSSRPSTSNVNFNAGQTLPNLVIVKVPLDGKIDFYNSSGGTVQVIADVEGYYAASGGGAFVPLNPSRVMDTREYLDGSPFTGYGLQTWSVAQAGFADYAAVVMNVTVTNTAGSGIVTVYPEGDTRPTTSNLNFTRGQTVPNLVMSGYTAGTTGGVNIYNGSPQGIDVVADLFGYFS
ncbi:right-handed parallel beta-helix repeat-containing protein [Actinospica sp. MGRD01-02]|uniref:Right-handed parallel beta-helix repeat-containing protein n=1 Tax=Actinospica acidithermotolerans TaxID=2828514 RepID=A0A941IEB8_9ACTN|nr:right-handed parallel beta-helix repeat-containing protein [Actinospica acidithermotolerans]MBR7825045.1 right-handed parallel beta-helix repeat-containing protein [Actinospica acidithermotolerans]